MNFEWVTTFADYFTNWEVLTTMWELQLLIELLGGLA